MKTLVIAFYPEGSTDIRFLSPIILRTAEQIILNRSSSVISVLEPFPIEVDKKGDRVQQIRQAAAKAFGYNILVVHADADYKSDVRAFQERINLAPLGLASRGGALGYINLAPLGLASRGGAPGYINLAPLGLALVITFSRTYPTIQ